VVPFGRIAAAGNGNNEVDHSSHKHVTPRDHIHEYGPVVGSYSKLVDDPILKEEEAQIENYVQHLAPEACGIQVLLFIHPPPFPTLLGAHYEASFVS